MKKVKWQGIGFLLIIFIFAIGLSYLALNKTNTGIADNGHQMSIALVNEDEGALFNGEQITFGDEFAKRVNSDSMHKWHVVSRGVADNGFQRNNYDMMIVVPNDFSEKSLAIHLDNPEPVTLHYKINASGHKDVRAEAEKTAGKILNDFNQQLIDVYFASVIGNLQDAQDSINDIINREVEYTTEYNSNIHTPLSDYTDQFQRLQNYTDNSKDSQDDFNSALDAFADRIENDVEMNQQFAQDVDTILEQRDNNSLFKNNYREYFNQFVGKMSDEDVLEQIKRLRKENRHVYDQFKNEEDIRLVNGQEEKESLISQANELQWFIEERLSEIGNLEEELYEEIYNNVETVVAEGLSISFEKDDRIYDLFPNVDENIHSEIKNQINKLPTLNIIRNSALSDDIVKDLNRIIRVSNKYSEEFEFSPNLSNDGNSFDAKIDEIKNKLITDGITVTDQVSGVPSQENYDIEVTVPKQFKQAGNYKVTKTKDGNGTTNTVSIALTLKLKSDQKMDIFNPVEWEWKLNTAEENNKDIVVSGQKQADTDTDKEADTEDSDAPETDAEENDAGDEGDEDEADDEGAAQINNAEAPQKTVSKTTITNSYFKQKVQSPIDSDSFNELLSGAADMLSRYYQLEGLYDLYFDFNGGKGGQSALATVDPNQSLKNQASKDSMYFLVHEMEVKDALMKSVAGNITQQITSHVQDSLDELNEQMDQYKGLVDSTTERTDSLINRMNHTQKHAIELNDHLQDVLNEVNDWRYTSMELAEKQNEVVLNDENMTMNMMNLDASYQPILNASESLKDQANADFNMSDHVYETIDTLGKEADAIEASGTNLVAHAQELADKLTDKAVEDADFADNFNEVLANSRVGDRQNDQLYEYLSNPVQTKNDGTITNSNSFIPYFIILIVFIMTLFTAYVFSNIGHRRVKRSTMDEDVTLMGMNRPISIAAAGVGLLEGLVVGLVSFFLLQLNQGDIYIWIGITMLLTMILLFFMTYLLRQLKMIGMFLILTVFSLYLLLTKSLGFYFEHISLVQLLKKISPLQYAENVLRNAMEGEFNVFLTFIFLLVFTVIGFFINLLVLRNKNGGETNEETAEAN